MKDRQIGTIIIIIMIIGIPRRKKWQAALVFTDLRDRLYNALKITENYFLVNPKVLLPFNFRRKEATEV